ncbi:hypothetical protein [Citrobacter freundii]|uniref:hypothetical protein n=1 Tax=Citrobacter freundii TaxID=546 RepID=UPI000668DBCD|nr:hypothetical protein [Citrobacter freundii]
MINRAKLQHILEYARQQRHIGMHCKVPPEDMVEIVEMAMQGADGALTNEDTKRVGELVMWVKRLAHSLRKVNPDSKLQSDAMDYLSKKGLIGVEDILR